MIKPEKYCWVYKNQDFPSANKNGQMEKMIENYNENKESLLLDFIQQHYGHEVFTPGLDRTRPLYEPFKKWVLESKIKITIIAGTNGKGQTAHTLAYYLKKTGRKIALWTSPHILSIRERFHFDQDVTYSKLEKEIYGAHDFLTVTFPGLKVSFYEFLFLVFLRLAKEEKNVNHLILEVGLGGKLDAVNHFDCDCACITSISRDHQAILGNRFDLILNEKIAVSRAGRPLFTQFRLAYLNERTSKYCQSHGIKWIQISADFHLDYFQENQKMAQELFTFLEPEKHIDFSTDVPSFKGRTEKMTFNQNALIFIGAHNIDGVRKMTELLSSDDHFESIDSVLISFSKRPEDEVIVMLKSMMEFFGHKTKMNLTHFEHPKALPEAMILEVEKEIHKMNKGMLTFVSDWKK